MYDWPTKVSASGLPWQLSYWNIPQIIAAWTTGAGAVHPGYGFLSENARFAEIVAKHGITSIQPHPEHMKLMGDKIAAKQAVARVGIHRARVGRRDRKRSGRGRSGRGLDIRC